jgi:hypothetical protein
MRLGVIPARIRSRSDPIAGDKLTIDGRQPVVKVFDKNV